VQSLATTEMRQTVAGLGLDGTMEDFDILFSLQEIFKRMLSHSETNNPLDDHLETLNFGLAYNILGLDVEEQHDPSEFIGGMLNYLEPQIHQLLGRSLLSLFEFQCQYISTMCPRYYETCYKKFLFSNTLL